MKFNIIQIICKRSIHFLTFFFSDFIYSQHNITESDSFFFSAMSFQNEFSFVRLVIVVILLFRIIIIVMYE